MEPLYSCTSLFFRLPYVYDLFQSLVKETRMRTLRKLWRNQRGQDLIEYALMAGFVAVAAGAVMPGVADSISTIFSQVASVMSIASTQG